MGDNHIITHGFRQQHEVVNLLEDNELKAFVWLDDYGIPFVTTCHFRTGVA
jgi:basic membrane lipoprotein Med (substrate-binding protein (PBP1-ABC) superfamily)